MKTFKRLLHDYAGGRIRGVPYAILTTIIICLPVPDGMANEEITQYRYRSFEGTEPPAWVSDYVASQTVLPGLVKTERGAGNDAFQQFWYANFNGNKRYVCADLVPGNDVSQDFSVTAWLNLSTTNGTQTIASTLDPANRTGFRLSVQNGRLIGEAWFNAASGRARLTVAAASTLETDKWRRVAFRRVKDPGTSEHFMDLWIDSSRVGRRSIAYSTEIDNSSLNAVFGADRTTTGFDDFLYAKVYAIQVDDYGWSDFFLSSPIIRDGSRSFGMPSYHDYLGEGAGKTPLERRVTSTHEDSDLAEFRSRLVDRWMFPFANDDYIPQGVAADQENHRLFISMYYEDVDGHNPNSFPSIVAEVLMPDGRLGNVFLLQKANGDPLTAHVGGVEYFDGLLIVANGASLVVYDISDVPSATFNPDTFANFNPRPIRAVQVVDQASDTQLPLVDFNSIAFVSTHYQENHTLWITLGDYDTVTPANNFRYQLTRQAEPPALFLTGLRIERQLTDNVQGSATYYDARSVVRSFQAGTGAGDGPTGGNESRIVNAIYDPPATGTPAKNAPTIYVPRGLEELAFYDCKLWTVSESGARKIQKRSSNPWPECYPFLYSLKIQDRLDTNSNRLPDQWEATMSTGGNADADADYDRDGFSTWDEYVADTHPLSRLDYPRIQIDWPSRLVLFDSSVLRFYTVESSTDLKNWTPLADFKHRRGIDAVMHAPIKSGARRFYQVLIEDK